MERYSDEHLTAEHGVETTQRSESRDSLFLTARFRYSATVEPVRVRIRNLSSGGLMVEYGGNIAIGSPVEVEVRGIGWVAGHVAWCAEQRVGVAFDQEVDPKRARRPVGTGAKNPRRGPGPKL
ncbi:PilZ domain-containing protein [Stakelama saccharophila]|uniref:PilZ domain-containing protein n=1 Tax=Stakelama saccharophila TaxID=3075605 RepID=A0ABZ0B7G8_9SPHN|nr:PilZ domain-containing protein [Stakelama sp. W311]WNO52571.1 PilZ domain-containing protein [Stakelama sp. W311]